MTEIPNAQHPWDGDDVDAMLYRAENGIVAHDTATFYTTQGQTAADVQRKLNDFLPDNSAPYRVYPVDLMALRGATSVKGSAYPHVFSQYIEWQDSDAAPTIKWFIDHLLLNPHLNFDSAWIPNPDQYNTPFVYFRREHHVTYYRYLYSFSGQVVKDALGRAGANESAPWMAINVVGTDGYILVCPGSSALVANWDMDGSECSLQATSLVHQQRMDEYTRKHRHKWADYYDIKHPLDEAAVNDAIARLEAKLHRRSAEEESHATR